MSHHRQAELLMALRDDAQALIVERLKWDEETDGEYTGPVDDRTNRLFSYMQDYTQRQKLFKVVTAGGNDYIAWSFMFTGDSNLFSKVVEELDYVTTEYPNHIFVLGAYVFKPGDIMCRQAGTQLVVSTRIVEKTWSVLNPDYQPDPEEPDFDDRYVLRVTGDVEEEYVSGYTGTPTYPLHPRLIDFMPDVGEPPVPATELADVNLLQGQPPRYFGGP